MSLSFRIGYDAYMRISSPRTHGGCTRSFPAMTLAPHSRVINIARPYCLLRKLYVFVPFSFSSAMILTDCSAFPGSCRQVLRS